MGQKSSVCGLRSPSLSLAVAACCLAAASAVAPAEIRFQVKNKGNGDGTASPVVSLVTNELFDENVDASIDFGVIYAEMDTGPLRSVRMASAFDSQRWFLSGNLSARKGPGSWVAGANAGWSFAAQQRDPLTQRAANPPSEGGIELGRLRIGGDLSYLFDGSFGSFGPFATAQYQSGYSREESLGFGGAQPRSDPGGYQVGGGLRWYTQSGVTASFQYETYVGSEEVDPVDEDTYSLQIRTQF